MPHSSSGIHKTQHPRTAMAAAGFNKANWEPHLSGHPSTRSQNSQPTRQAHGAPGSVSAKPIRTFSSTHGDLHTLTKGPGNEPQEFDEHGSAQPARHVLGRAAAALVDSSTLDEFSWITRLSFTERNTRCGRVIRLATASGLALVRGHLPAPNAAGLDHRRGADLPSPQEFTHMRWTTAVSSPYGTSRQDRHD